ncbi:dynein regulatory complex subunit 7 [Myripristis murdjan]|uniref:dynein regulatory complex subunit 7 n=1 Tax=Myripristis murdjan TaxID=586833 RepID=UPI001175E4A0|nr:dynein regulatory complex subunit 7 [Myripristis murdjan]
MYECPASYKENSAQERKLLAMVGRFRREFADLFPDRRPLLLCPFNEFGIRKFVCTTLRPTMVPYPDLYDWDTCASFVADHLSLELLEPPIDPPRYLLSPTLVLHHHRGTCFDFSTLLCSLLLGDGYDAYCVSGYAVKEICQRDQSLQECPLLVTEVKDTIPEQEPEQVNKYTVKPLWEPKSCFEQKQQEEAKALQLKKQHEAQLLQEESEQPPPDPLLGCRVHCWVLVLSGRRDVTENFFIDPLRGQRYSTTNEKFLGIDSIWNSVNYWVNMQDCSQGCANIVYDLENTMMWESVISGSAAQTLSVSSFKESEMAFLNDDEEEQDEEPKLFVMPWSWVSEITISKEEVHARWPDGMGVTHYRKAKLERYSPYLLPDGLMTRLTTYKDLKCTKASMVKEGYQNRNDRLEERELNMDDNVTTERFGRFARFSLKSHRYVTYNTDTEREMEFYSCGRYDKLVRRVESPGEMTETFQGRRDFLYYRHVIFAQQVLEPGEMPESDVRPLQKVVERFQRNRAKPASEDVAERVFLLTEGRIQVTCHFPDDRLFRAKRIFTKPRDETRQKYSITDLVFIPMPDPFEKPPGTLRLYRMLKELMEEETTMIESVNESQKEIRAILASREQEESNIELRSSVYQAVCIEKARRFKKDMERIAEEERLWRQERENDILAPFLMKLGNTEILCQTAAVQVHRDCLASLKQKLTAQANHIQKRCEKLEQELQQKQEWHQQNLANMTKEDEDKYLADCHDTMFMVHVAKLRLSRHEATAPLKYQALDEKLRRDPRLAPHLH